MMVVDKYPGFSRAGIRFFHTSMILRTDMRGEHGEICGRHKSEVVSEMAEELITLIASAKGLENVLVKSLGLSCVQLLLVVAISPLVGGAKRDEDDRASEEVVETVEPALLFARDKGQEP